MTVATDQIRGAGQLANRWLLRYVPAIVLACAIAPGAPARAQDAALGAELEPLLAYARTRNPEFAALQAEADASHERIVPAGALPDPKFAVELRDITRSGEQNPTLSPGRTGSTRYLLLQEIPWFGKRDLRREVAELEAEGARERARGNWAEVAGRIKINFAQLYYLYRSERLTRQILDLLSRLERIALARYAGGLAAQQDVIRAQVEQTSLRSELITLETERHHVHTRLNTLLARTGDAPLQEPARLRPLPPPAALDYAALDERARARNPQLFADEAKLRAAEKTRELTYRNRYPDFAFGVAPVQYQNSIREWELIVELSIPLQQSSRRAQEREAESLLAAARARKQASTSQVSAELAESLSAIEAARRTENLLASSLLPQAELTFQAALAGYETGKVDFATLLDAQRQIRLARQNQLKAQVDARIRLAEVERLLGDDL